MIKFFWKFQDCFQNLLLWQVFKHKLTNHRFLWETFGKLFATFWHVYNCLLAVRKLCENTWMGRGSLSAWMYSHLTLLHTFPSQFHWQHLQPAQEGASLGTSFVLSGTFPHKVYTLTLFGRAHTSPLPSATHVPIRVPKMLNALSNWLTLWCFCLLLDNQLFCDGWTFCQRTASKDSQCQLH